MSRKYVLTNPALPDGEQDLPIQRLQELIPEGQQGDIGPPGSQGPPGADAPTDYAYSDAEIDTITF